MTDRGPTRGRRGSSAVERALVGVLVVVTVLPVTACGWTGSASRLLETASAPSLPASSSPSGATPSSVPSGSDLRTPEPAVTTSATPSGTPSATVTPRSTLPPARAGTALAALRTLAVKGRAPRTGYVRAQFGGRWPDVDHNGCDTRNDILRRDLRGMVLRSGDCVVATGVLLDPYTGASIDFVRGPRSAEVQIDHVVALADAWQKAAQGWTLERRTAFANDPLELLAVGGAVNQAKSDGDAATWLPPRAAYRCAYVARQIAVKAKYRLWVTAAEGDAMARVLARCPSQPLPVR